MAGRDNNFVKVHARLRTEMAVLTGGLAVHSVFIMCLELAREHSTDGTFPAAYLTPQALRLRFRIEPFLTDEWLAGGIAGVIQPYCDGDNVVRSLAVIEDGTVFLPGWEDDYKRHGGEPSEGRTKGMSSTERSRRRRERLAAERLSATADATTATGATARNGDATECNVAPLHGPLQPVACNDECNGSDRLEAAPQAACNGVQRMQRCNGLDKKRVEEKKQQQPRAYVQREAVASEPAAAAAAVGYDDEEPLKPWVHTGETFEPSEPPPEPAEMPALRSAWIRMLDEMPTPDAEKALKRWWQMRESVEVVEYALGQAAAAGKKGHRQVIPYAQRIVRSATPEEWDPKAKTRTPGQGGPAALTGPACFAARRDPDASRTSGASEQGLALLDTAALELS